MRNTTNQNISIAGIPFIGFWWSGNDTGLSVGLKTGLSRNIHITTFLRDDVLNCHITDTGKSPSKIWEMKLPISSMESIADEFINTSIQKYSWFKRYYQLSPDLYQVLAYSFNQSNMNFINYDVEPVIRGFLNEDALVRKRIRSGYHEGARLGFIFEDDNDYIVFPLDKNQIFIHNTDIKKTVLWKFPFTQGLFRYLDYIEQEQILDQSKKFSKEKMDQIGTAIMGIIGEKMN
jgi:hypothetical protein